MNEIYGTFSTAYVEAMRLRLSALEPENKGLSARVSELEAENKTLRDRFSDADTERNADQAALKAAFARVAEMENCIEDAWGIIANVSRGNWCEQHPEWQEAAINWRDQYVITRHESMAKDGGAIEARVSELEARCKRLEEALKECDRGFTKNCPDEWSTNGASWKAVREALGEPNPWEKSTP